MERASSSCIFMSAMRWRSAWKLLMATPNCLRVFMYSAVMATVLSITPTASAQAAAMPMSTACSRAIEAIGGDQAGRRVRELQIGGARAVLRAVAARGRHRLALRSTRNRAILPSTVAGTMKASAWSPAGTMFLVAVK